MQVAWLLKSTYNSYCNSSKNIFFVVCGAAAVHTTNSFVFEIGSTQLLEKVFEDQSFSLRLEQLPVIKVIRETLLFRINRSMKKPGVQMILEQG